MEFECVTCDDYIAALNRRIDQLETYAKRLEKDNEELEERILELMEVGDE